MGLLVKPLSPKTRSPNSMMDDINKTIDKLDFENVIEGTLGEIKSELAAMGAVFTVKQGAKKIPFVGWAWQIATISGDLEQLAYFEQVWSASKREAERIHGQLSDIKGEMEKIVSKMETLKKGGLSESRSQKIRGSIQSDLADFMRSIATHECMHAR